jgi:hypothetical protein
MRPLGASEQAPAPAGGRLAASRVTTERRPAYNTFRKTVSIDRSTLPPLGDSGPSSWMLGVVGIVFDGLRLRRSGIKSRGRGLETIMMRGEPSGPLRW